MQPQVERERLERQITVSSAGLVVTFLGEWGFFADLQQPADNGGSHPFGTERKQGSSTSTSTTSLHGSTAPPETIQCLAGRLAARPGRGPGKRRGAQSGQRRGVGAARQRRRRGEQGCLGGGDERGGEGRGLGAVPTAEATSTAARGGDAAQAQAARGGGTAARGGDAGPAARATSVAARGWGAAPAGRTNSAARAASSLEERRRGGFI
ncbi:hypothetical protein U9M48_006594 [Paspalum notatum var. saurae]|uniref:Uncharacterized protein n=1 Tax=Paspalum notatum var. saurae TaxID=547442 RepID=A0AAQ3PTK1_PASNO